MIREFIRLKTDLGEDLWHLAQEIECVSVGLLQINPETVQGHDGIVSESAATFRGGGFVAATDSIFG
jgi:hypothetical protein